MKKKQVAALCLVSAFVGIGIMWIIGVTYNPLSKYEKTFGINNLKYFEVERSLEPLDYGPHGEADSYYVLKLTEENQSAVLSKVKSEENIYKIGEESLWFAVKEINEAYAPEGLSDEINGIETGYFAFLSPYASEYLNSKWIMRDVCPTGSGQLWDWYAFVIDIENMKMYIWEKHL